jgi:Tfp pilus assembly protein PilN
VNRNKTPKAVRAAGARDAHGRILDPTGGALYVHLHREVGLAHRHYVLRSWQVRGAALLLSRPMLVLYFLALVTWGWMAAQAARVPLLQQEIARLTLDAHRLDTLSATLTELQTRYEQVQRMLGAATARDASPPADSARRAGLGGR